MKNDASTAVFPDGTPIPEYFFSENRGEQPSRKAFSATEFGILPDRPDLIQTGKIQNAIDSIAEKGGGTLLFTPGTYLSGSVFFRPGVHLRLEKNAVLLGSPNIDDFALLPTRMEGRTVNYFAALVNADRCSGFTISGEGVLDGNGLSYWRHFWLRRKFNPECTNMDEMRPRILYVSNSEDVTVKGIEIRNSPFWSTHYYRCIRLTLEDLRITSPVEPVKAPSTDAVDLDACEFVHIRNSYFSVNDDAIALKGGKGEDAAVRPENGKNTHVLIENCAFGFCHSCLTCGSETIHNRNIIMRDCEVSGADRLFRLKMRPDTPQKNEHILLSNIRGTCNEEVFLFDSWTQFRESRNLLPSTGEHILAEHMDIVCRCVYRVLNAEEYRLEDIRIQNSRFIASEPEIHKHDGINVLNIAVSLKNRE